MSSPSSSFTRPAFSLPLGTDPFLPPHTHIRTIYDVLTQTAASNPSHPYALQFTDRACDIDRAITVSHGELLRAVDRCSAWLVHNNLAQRSIAVSPNEGGQKTVRGKPVAVFLGSDLNIFIHVVALLKLGNPVAIFSARLSGAALQHLVHAISVDRILTTPSQWRSIQDEVSPSLSAHTFPVRPFTDFLSSTELDDLPVPEKGDEPDQNDKSVFAWHSSGSTGLPKPVFHTHRFWHCCLACHQFSEQDSVHRKVALNMPPLYHGFGMLPMALAISVGFTVALPPPSTIPTAQLIIDLLRITRANLLFTVPSLLTDILVSHQQQQEDALEALRALDVVAFAGAPIKPSTADVLAQAGVPLLNHFGATETGSLAAIRFPPPSYQWRHLLLREDMGLEFGPMPGVGRVGDQQQPETGFLQLSCRPFGWAERFFLADALVPHPITAVVDGATVTLRTEYSIAGRTDQVIVLATGEKVSPNLLEEALCDQPEVDGAILFGTGRFQIGALVELSASVEDASPSSSSFDDWQTRILDKLWTALAPANAQADAHAKLERGLIVLTTPSRKPFVRTAKGTAARGATLEVFEGEIGDAYEALEFRLGWDQGMGQGGRASLLPLEGESDTLASWESSVSKLVSSCLLSPHHHDARTENNSNEEERTTVQLGKGDDFFETLGMDSLKAARLMRLLLAGLREREGRTNDNNVHPDSESRTRTSSLPKDLVYRYCTVTALSLALRRHLGLPEEEDGEDALVGTNGGGGGMEYGLGMDERSIAERGAVVDALVQEVEDEMKTWGLADVGNTSAKGTLTNGSAGSERSEEGATVLLTGSTGALGAWLVHTLLTTPSVTRLICLVRTSASASANEPPLERQLASLRSKGVPELTASQRERLTVLGTPDLAGAYFGLGAEVYYSQLVSAGGGVSHIVHNAWSVDFLRPLRSFRNQVRATARLVHLASSIGAVRGRRVRFVFSSSIAVVGRSYALPKEETGMEVERIMEEELDGAARTVPMGYALAKLACEKLVSRASSSSSDTIDGTSIRIGQLTGAEGVGNWSAAEHMALILQSSAHLGALPRLGGDAVVVPDEPRCEGVCPDRALPPVLVLVFGWVPEDLPFGESGADGVGGGLECVGGGAGTGEARKRQRTGEALVVAEEPDALLTPAISTSYSSDGSRQSQQRIEDFLSAVSHAAVAQRDRVQHGSASLTPPDTPDTVHSLSTSTVLPAKVASLSLRPSSSKPSTTSSAPKPTPTSPRMPIIDFPTWLDAVRTSTEDECPARKLLDFLEGDFVPIATGKVVLDMRRAQGMSGELRERVEAVGSGHVREYVGYWRRMGLPL